MTHAVNAVNDKKIKVKFLKPAHPYNIGDIGEMKEGLARGSMADYVEILEDGGKKGGKATKANKEEKKTEEVKETKKVDQPDEKIKDKKNKAISSSDVENK